MTGLWDVGKDPLTWDFAVYLACVKTLGVDHVNFGIERPGPGKFRGAKLPPEVIAERRFDNILKPLCELAGVAYSIGMEGMRHGFHLGDLNRVYAEHKTLWKYVPMTDSGKRGYVTITLRESFRKTFRNSNIEAWYRVAAEIGKDKPVIVLQDCEYKPMPVAQRMELYAHADMNLSVSNGPAALLYLSEAPYLVFNMIPHMDERRIYEQHLSSGGFGIGSQFDFRNERQAIVWDHDDYEVIMKAYHE